MDAASMVGGLVGQLSALAQGSDAAGEVSQDAAVAAQVATTTGWPRPLAGIVSPPAPAPVVGIAPQYAWAGVDAWCKAWFNAYASDLLRQVAAAFNWRIQ